MYPFPKSVHFIYADKITGFPAILSGVLTVHIVQSSFTGQTRCTWHFFHLYGPLRANPVTNKYTETWIYLNEYEGGGEGGGRPIREECRKGGDKVAAGPL